MKKIIALGFILSVQLVAAMEKTIKMPNKNELQRRLDEIGMTYFSEKTNIISQLADQEKVPLGVAMAVELAMYDYFKYVESVMPASMVRMQKIQMKMHKPLIFEALLKDEPEALKELEAHDLYKPVDSSNKCNFFIV